MTNFTLLFIVAVIWNAAVTLRSSGIWKSSSSGSSNSSSSHADPAEVARWKALLRKYLPVYLLATLSDWLQGPYVYALYADYGYSQHSIAILFVAGFGSSMIFGSFIGGMADWGGRRAFVVIFALVYASSCFTKHFKSFYILMLGRLLGGVATSLLFSVFDAWLIRAHSDAQLKQYLGKSFSWAVFGNSLIAILAGLLANNAASATMPMVGFKEGIFVGGYLTPFDLALVALIGCGFLAATTWDENYGDTDSAKGGGDEIVGGNKAQWHDGLKNALTTTIRSTDILLCGIISSLFEGSMYVFVFMWTPALTAGDDEDTELPFGLIFSTFMVCCMAGSSIYSVCSDKMKGEQLGVLCFAVASVSMALVAVSPSNTMKFVAMNVFEMTVGMYWPIMGTMKGSIVPESMRAAIYNLYRIPLNFIVLFSLLTDLTPTTSFCLNATMLATAAVLQIILMKRRELHLGASHPATPPSDETEDTRPLVAKDESV